MTKFPLDGIEDLKVVEDDPGDPRDEGGRYGPAMQALSERQRKFVVALLNSGGKNAKLAAREAGYGAGNYKNALEVQAHRLMHTDTVLEAIREESVKRMRSYGLALVSDLVEIAGDRENSVKDRLKAIDMVLNRTGMQAIMEHKVTVEDKRSRADLVKELIAGLLELGVSPSTLLEPPKLIDVTPEKVTDE